MASVELQVEMVVLQKCIHRLLFCAVHNKSGFPVTYGLFSMRPSRVHFRLAVLSLADWGRVAVAGVLSYRVASMLV